MPTHGFLPILSFSFLISLGAVVSPGPVSAAIITEAPRQGWRVGPLVSAGHCLLELAMLVLISLGLASGMATPFIQRAIGSAGGLMLLGMGSGYMLAAGRNRMRLASPEQDVPRRNAPSLSLLGLATTVSNPYWYAWWVTVAATYIAQARSAGIWAMGAFFVGHIGADFGWNTLLSVTAHAGSSWLTQSRYRGLILLTGFFMIYLGIQFLRQALLPTSIP